MSANGVFILQLFENARTCSSNERFVSEGQKLPEQVCQAALKIYMEEIMVDTGLLLNKSPIPVKARHDGVKVEGWTFDQGIQVRFPAYLHCVRAPWSQGS